MTISRTSVRVAEGGRIVIPADVRRQCGFDIGSEVVLTVEDGRVTLMSPAVAVQKAQQLVSRYVPANVSLSQELRDERKTEAKRE